MKRRDFIHSTSAALAAGTMIQSCGSNVVFTSKPVKLFLVGGFLGSGKTTFLWNCAQQLAKQGISVGFVTNDQAPDLVDTKFLSHQKAIVKEVSGGCFCCNFNSLTDAIDQLREKNVDLILAEPVGSCADLSATVIQPLKRFHPDITLSPYSVLAEPSRLLEAFGKKPTTLFGNVLYILRLQILEADIVLVNKHEATTSEDHRAALDILKDVAPDALVYDLSSWENDAAQMWMNHMIGQKESGGRIVEVDYDRYAEGEAALGWLNADIDIEIERSITQTKECMMSLFQEIKNSLRRGGGEAGHIKAIFSTPGEDVFCNLTGVENSIRLQTKKQTSATEETSLVLNARAQATSQQLSQIIEEALISSFTGKASHTIRALHCFSPPRPTPTHRISTVL